MATGGSQHQRGPGREENSSLIQRGGKRFLDPSAILIMEQAVQSNSLLSAVSSKFVEKKARTLAHHGMSVRG